VAIVGQAIMIAVDVAVALAIMRQWR